MTPQPDILPPLEVPPGQKRFPEPPADFVPPVHEVTRKVPPEPVDVGAELVAIKTKLDTILARLPVPP